MSSPLVRAGALIPVHCRFLFLLLGALLLVSGALAYDNSIPEATSETFVGGPENLQLVTDRDLDHRLSDYGSRAKARTKRVRHHRWIQVRIHAFGRERAEVAQVVGALADMTNFGGAFTCDFDPA